MFEPLGQISPLPNSARTIFESMHTWAAVKRSRRAQTVLGDRHDPICDFFVSTVGRLRNSPGRIFQRLETQTATDAAAESVETVIEIDFSWYSKRAFFVFVSKNPKRAESLESLRPRAAPTRLQQSIRLLPGENRRVPLQVQRHIQVR